MKNLRKQAAAVTGAHGFFSSKKSKKKTRSVSSSDIQERTSARGSLSGPLLSAGDVENGDADDLEARSNHSGLSQDIALPGTTTDLAFQQNLLRLDHSGHRMTPGDFFGPLGINAESSSKRLLISELVTSR
jgi:hypothetical protein